MATPTGETPATFAHRPAVARPRRRRPRALLRVAAALLGIGALASFTGSVSPSAATQAAGDENGRIAYVSAWAKDVAGEVHRVDVASGRRTNLSRSLADDEGAVVSPDGRTILFASSRGNSNSISIWAMNANGGAQRSLALGRDPTWSRDGTRIAFERDEDVMTMTASGTDVRRVARGHSPAWSPAGDALAWIDDQTVRVGAPDGSSTRAVFSTTSLVSTPAWSPDGKQIAVGAEVLLESGAVFHGLVVLPAAGGEARRLASVPAGDTFFELAPRWSPDGARIAFVRGRRIAVARVADSAVVMLTTPGSGIADSRPAWSPDGRLVAFARGARDVFVVPSAGGRARAVGREDVHARLGYSDELSWTPNGRSLVYARRLLENDTDLFTVLPGNVDRRRLTTSSLHEWSPAFSPDGRWIAFVRTLRGARGTVNDELFVMRADGTGIRRLTRNPRRDHDPAWSPDGSRIVFARKPSLFTIRPDGTGLTRLRVPRAQYGSPSWSPNGNSILAATWEWCPPGGTLRILRQRKGRWAVVRDVVARDAGDGEWAPDGRSISFVEPCENDYYQSSSVRTMRLDASPQVLAAGGTDATWSPDGRFLAVTGPWLQSSLAIVSRAGRRERELTIAHEAQPDLSWQPLCTLRGSDRADLLRAGRTAVRACGHGGRDTIRGGGARDRLFGGDGDDSIDARGGGFDVVGCGAGRDRVRADRGDLVGVDCEQVSRR